MMTPEPVITFVETPSRASRLAPMLFLGLLSLATFCAAWMLVQEGAKRQVIRQFATAMQSGNMGVIVTQTDWISVRNELKKDLKWRAALNKSLPAQPHQVDELVDYYVRPESLPDLMNFYQAKAPSVAPEAFVRNVHFSGLTEITVEMGVPPQLDKPWLNHLEPVRAVLKLDGFGWRLKKLDAPDYLIPTIAPTKSFLKRRA